MIYFVKKGYTESKAESKAESESERAAADRLFLISKAKGKYYEKPHSTCVDLLFGKRGLRGESARFLGSR